MYIIANDQNVIQDANSDQIVMLRRKQAEIEILLPSLQVKSAEIRNTLLNVHVTDEMVCFYIYSFNINSKSDTIS